MRVLALLETVEKSEDKKGDLPGKGHSMSKGGAGMQGPMWHAQDKAGGAGDSRKSRSLSVRLLLWTWLCFVKPLKDCKHGGLGVTVVCSKSSARCQLKEQAVESGTSGFQCWLYEFIAVRCYTTVLACC